MRRTEEERKAYGTTYSPVTDGCTLPGASAAGTIGLVAVAAVLAAASVPAFIVVGVVVEGCAGVDTHRTATTLELGSGGRRATARLRGGMKLRTRGRRYIVAFVLGIVSLLCSRAVWDWICINIQGRSRR
jgi:hypothetical protein